MAHDVRPVSTFVFESQTDSLALWIFFCGFLLSIRPKDFHPDLDTKDTQTAKLKSSIQRQCE